MSQNRKWWRLNDAHNLFWSTIDGGREIMSDLKMLEDSQPEQEFRITFLGKRQFQELTLMPYMYGASTDGGGSTIL